MISRKKQFPSNSAHKWGHPQSSECTKKEECPLQSHNGKTILGLIDHVSFVIIWHFMAYDAYDIEIWHRSNWSIFVSKRPSGPQQSQLFIRFWPKNRIKKEIPSINFENAFYFQPNLKSIFTYQKGLKSKICLAKCF